MTVSLNKIRFNLYRSISVLKKPLLILIIVSLGSLVFVACEDDPTSIGKDLLPGSDYVTIESIDTLKPISFTMYDDATSSGLPNYGYMGQLRDPYFGTTNASFVTQLRLKKQWTGDTITIDSVRLFLELTVKGTSTALQTLNISEISSQINTTSTYYTNTDVPESGYQASIFLPGLKTDTINSLVIKLPDISFGERIFQDTTMLFHNNATPDFRSYFKGLHFTLTSLGAPLFASMVLVNENDTENGYQIIDKYYKNFFEINYHDNSGEKHAYYLVIDAINRNASFNKFDHNFSAADPDKVIENYNNLSNRDTITYSQSFNGLYTRILLPGLKDLRSSGNFSNIAVSKAHLTLPFFYDSDLYKPSNLPSRLYLRYRTKGGKKPYVQDIGLDQYSEFFGGNRDTINNVYSFNIAAFVQEYFKDTSDSILPELEVVQSSEISNIILKANDSSTPVTFDFTYIRF